jgi:hypothetical protein
MPWWSWVIIGVVILLAIIGLISCTVCCIRRRKRKEYNRV